MHTFRSFIVLAALLGAVTPVSAKPLVAVLDFGESRTGLHADELSLLGDVSRGAALRALGHQYDVITRENLVDLLNAHGKNLSLCSGECETETGRLLGAELVVSGRIVKAFGKYKVNLKVHRTDPPALLGAEMMTADDHGGLEEAVRLGTSKLLATVPGSRSSASARRSPTPPPSRAAPPPAAVTESAATPSAVGSATRTEWWSAALTNGAFDEDEYVVGLSATGPLLRWPHFYWQSIRLTYFAIEGDEGYAYTFSSFAGYRTSLGAGGRSELRIGAGWGALDSDESVYNGYRRYSDWLPTVEVAYSMPYDETKSWQFVLQGLFPTNYGYEDCYENCEYHDSSWYIDPTYLLHIGLGF